MQSQAKHIACKSSKLTGKCRLFSAMLIICGLYGSIAIANNDWEVLLKEADRVSRQGNTTESSIRAGQDSALFLGEKALEMLDASADESHCHKIRVLIRMGDYNFRLEKLEEAKRHWKLALTEIESNCTSESILLSDVLQRLGILNIEFGLQSDDEQLDYRVASLYKSLWNSNAPEDLRSIYRFAHVYDFHIRYVEFHALMRNIVRIWNTNESCDPKPVIRALVYLAEEVSKTRVAGIGFDHNSQDSAIFVGTKALKIAEQTLDSNNTLIAYVATRLGDYHAKIGDYKSSLALWKRAYEINTSAYPPEHIEYQGSIMRMAGIYKTVGRYAEAEPLYLEAVRLREQTQGAGHPETAIMYSQLAGLYHKVGDYLKAERHYRHALSIREHAIERVDSDIAQSHIRIGRLYIDMGEYSAAELEFATALNLRRKSLGESHTLTASCYIHLARLYSAWGRTTIADSVYRKAIMIKSEFLGINHPSVTKTKQDYALFLIDNQQYDLARAMMEETYEIWKRATTWNREEYIESLTGLGRIASGEGQLSKAEQYFEEALESKTTYLGATDKRSVSQICDLAEIYSKQRKYDSADSLYQSALQFINEIPLLLHPDIARLHEEYSQLCFAQGQYDLALENAEKALRIRKEHYAQAMMVLAEVEALKYAEQLKQSYYDRLSFVIAEERVGADRLNVIANTILNSKGIVTNTVARRLHLKNDKDSAHAHIKDSLRFISAAISRNFVSDISVGKSVSDTSVLKLLFSAKNRLESQLARIEGTHIVSDEATSAELLSHLPDSTLIVDILRFPRIRMNEQQEAQRIEEYIAIIGDNNGWIRSVCLGSADPIDNAIDVYSEHMRDIAISSGFPDEKSLSDYRTISLSLTSLLWEPLSVEVENYNRVIIDGDWKVHQVSFAGLLDTDSTYLIEKFEFHYISGPRDVFHDAETSQTTTGLLAIGDPDFDALPFLPVIDESTQIASYLPNTSTHFNAVRMGCEIFDGFKATRLMATAQEIDAVTSIWKSTTTESMSKLIRYEATESAFKHMSQNARVIHISTHAYFINDACQELFSEQSLGNINLTAKTNPMLLTGILLAGVNMTVSDRSTSSGEDGFLTAEEVCMLDLSGTQCVVLSACETGLGNIISGEGVYGLRRAFQLAGAHTVISSLWPVLDVSTASFMNRLYKTKGRSMPYVMRKAALSVIEDLRLRGQPDHPYIWAAFVACGDTKAIFETTDHLSVANSNGKAR